MSDKPEILHEDLSRPKTPLEYFRLFFSGFAMGSADIVPGVSGGTMAFILGIYETLINAIKSFNLTAMQIALKFDVQKLLDYIPFRFLIALGLGILAAIFMLSSLLHDLLNEQPTFLFAFFAGLIVASIVAIGVKVQWTPQAIAAVTVTTVAAFFLVGINAPEGTTVEQLVDALRHDEDTTQLQADLILELENAGYGDAENQVNTLVSGVQAEDDVTALENEMVEFIEENAEYEASDPVTLFFSGMVAICAMILPGVSGSFLLLVMNQYEAVLGAVKNLDILSLMAVAAGAAIGIAAFSRVISWLLKNYENVTVAGLVGFMIGAMRLIWDEAARGITIISDSGSLAGSQIMIVLALIAAGFVLVSLLDHMQSRSNPFIRLFWRAGPAVDDISEKAEALD